MTETERGESFSLLAVLLASLALLGAVFGVGLGLRAVDEADEGGGVAASATAEVVLSEFAIEPSTIEVDAGATLVVRNEGSAQHDLTVVDTDLATPHINPGDEAELDLSGLAAGTYEVRCLIPGHADSGMTGTLVIGGEGATAAPHGHEAMDFEEMDRVMRERTLQFPAETDGVGAQELAPEVLADGTKQFELTASVFDWEVEPGKVVEAWGYNEQVPGPTIRVDVGDKIRIVVHNELEESTSLHSHGFTLPNEMDGVPDITQLAIKPGDSLAYEWTISEPMVGMYHSHHHAEVQVPNGMLGAFYAGDMPLPAGTPTPAVDMPMVLNDAGTIGLSLNGKSFPATAPVVAKPGDWVKLDYMNEGLQIHPMHLHGMPQLVIARDGYPLAQPQLMDTVTVAPGERISVLVHATEPGAWAWHCHILNHAERSDGMFGMVTALVVQ